MDPDPLPDFPSTEEEFNYYAKFLQPLVASLSSDKDKIPAARWAIALAAAPPSALRNEYLKQLLVCCAQDAILGVFASWPPSAGQLRPLPSYHSADWLQTMARAKEQRPNQEEKPAAAEEAAQDDGGKDHDAEQKPPGQDPEPQAVVTEVSTDGREYIAVQDMQNGGGHVYYAFSDEPLGKWTGAMGLGDSQVEAPPGRRSTSGFSPLLTSSEYRGLDWLIDHPGYVSLPSAERPDSALWQEASELPDWALEPERCAEEDEEGDEEGDEEDDEEEDEEWYPAEQGGGSGPQPFPNDSFLSDDQQRYLSTMRSSYNNSFPEWSPLASSSGREYSPESPVHAAAIALPIRSRYGPQLYAHPAYQSHPSYDDSYSPYGARHQWRGAYGNSIGESDRTQSSVDSSPLDASLGAGGWPYQYQHQQSGMQRSLSEPDASGLNEAYLDEGASDELWAGRSVQPPPPRQPVVSPRRRPSRGLSPGYGGRPRERDSRAQGEFKSGAARRAANTRQWAQRSLSDSSLLGQSQEQTFEPNMADFQHPRFASTPRTTTPRPTPSRATSVPARRRLVFPSDEEDFSSPRAAQDLPAATRASSTHADADRQAVLLAVPNLQQSRRYSMASGSPYRPGGAGAQRVARVQQFSGLVAASPTGAQMTAYLRPNGATATASYMCSPAPSFTPAGPRGWARVQGGAPRRAMSPSWRRAVVPRRLSFMSDSSASDAEPQVEFPPSTANSSAFTALQPQQAAPTPRLLNRTYTVRRN